MAILNFHRLGPPDGSAYAPLDARLFERLLVWLKRHFEITTFARLAEPAERPRAILSFDDGYRDFVEVAMPILARHHVAANLNVVPRCAETGLPPLNILAADFIGQVPPERVRALRIAGIDSAAPGLWPRLDAHIKRLDQAGQDALEAELAPQLFAWEGFRPTPMMSVDDIRAAAAAGHEIGGHSFAHVSMDAEADDRLRADIARCRAWLGERLGLDMRIWAFPNGRLRPGQERVAADAGVAHVLLLGDGLDDGRSPHRRLGMGGKSLPELRWRALGRFLPVARR